MKRMTRVWGTLAIACAATASLTIAAHPDAHAATTATTPDTDVAVPAGFTLLPAGSYAPLPVGDPDLTETRSVETLAPGVTLTHVVRGDEPDAIGSVNTTMRGSVRRQHGHHRPDSGEGAPQGGAP